MPETGTWPARVFVVADPVFDVGAPAMATLQPGDVGVGLVGENRLEAVAVVVGKTTTGRRGAGAHGGRSAGRPAARAERDAVADLGDLAVEALAAVLVERLNPGRLGNFQDRGTDRFGQLIADREAARSTTTAFSRIATIASSGTGVERTRYGQPTPSNRFPSTCRNPVSESITANLIPA